MNQMIPPSPQKIALIQACWHFDIVDRCREGFLQELQTLGRRPEDVDIFKVPGVFDIPLLAKKICQRGSHAAMVASGFVVDGGIYRHDFVSATVIDALMQVQLETGVPVLSAVLTPHQIQETEAHEAFFREHFVVKGAEAARACVQVLDNFAELAAA
ncbi:MAG: 6,7-dimethyl-8-ribityllumazine synthase [Pseudomonadota bacterium]